MTKSYDAIIVGAGFSGLYALHRLREAGLTVKIFEMGEGVGGTWYWNRYPGARTDSTSNIYQYFFSDDLLKEWDWQERFPSQEETERYLNFVADKFDLRRDIQFKTKVTAADYAEESGLWSVKTSDGEQATAQFFVMCTGVLTEPVFPDIPGRESFAGTCLHTSRWPKEPVDFSGKRVGVFGTGATGIQVIQTLADKVGHLTVFQRTPTYTVQMRNSKLDDAARADMRAQYPKLKTSIHNTFIGADFDFDERSFYEVDKAERHRMYEELWEDGSLALWVGSFREVFTDQEASEEVSAFVREKIRSRIKDPKVAEKLVPTSYLFGTRRVPLETNYYEAFNRDNVELVDLKETPVERITETGVTTAAGHHDLDILIFATGFDAATGALTHMDLRGKDGVLLRDAWADGLRTFMGLQVSGYPNLFLSMGPLSPAAAFCNAPTCIQQQIEWITDCIEFVRRGNRRTIEPTAEAEAKWIDHHLEVAEQVLATKTDSWYMGSNIKGKKRGLLAYAGGHNVYTQLCTEVKDRGFQEFALT